MVNQVLPLRHDFPSSRMFKIIRICRNSYVQLQNGMLIYNKIGTNIKCCILNQIFEHSALILREKTIQLVKIRHSILTVLKVKISDFYLIMSL